MQTAVSTDKRSIATVIASFLHFDLCFTLWVLLGSLSIFITNDLHLNAAQQGVMVAVPTLSGSVMRIAMGILSDRVSGKKVGVTMLLFLFLPLLLGWLLRVNFPIVIAIGLLLGVAGASFAVALPLASRWYPPERQGLIMGITAAGNIGTVVANLSAPALALRFGWHDVMALAMFPLGIVLLVFVLLAKESPSRPQGLPLSASLAALKRGNIWWLCLFYSVTFGGFVGLSTFLPLFLKNQYAFHPLAAGLLTALVAFLASSLRPFGGWLSDTFGGTRVLSLLLVGIVGLYGVASLLPGIKVMVWVLFALMSCLGMGNGAVFQLVPQYFRREIGVATGIVGAFGGVGGFFLPTLLGGVKQWSNSYGIGLLILAGVALVALVVLRLLVALQAGWRLSPKTIAEGKGA